MSRLPLSTARVSRVVLRKALAYGLTALVAMAIAILTLAPVSVPNGLPGTDKIYHLISFAALALPSAVLYPRGLVLVLPFAIVFGGAIEIIQPAVGRSGEWPDFYADISGIGLGVFVGLCARHASGLCACGSWIVRWKYGFRNRTEVD